MTSQTQTVLGASSSLVARRAEDESNDIKTQPGEGEIVVLDFLFGGEMVWRALTNW